MTMTTERKKGSIKLSLNKGFTLIEMALVLAIMGIVGVIYLEAGIAVSDQRNINNAISEIEGIQNSIIDFTVRSHRLPCPSDPTLVSGQLQFGEESKTVIASPFEVECLLSSGDVPWNNFGLLEENSIDPWGTKYKYVVHIGSASYSLDAGDAHASPCNADTLPGGSDVICTRKSLGGLDYREVPYGTGKFVNMIERYDLEVRSLSGSLLTNQIAYAIISAGPNRQFEQVAGQDITQDEKCYNGAQCAAAGDVFDDIVIHPTLTSIIRTTNHSPENIDDGI